MSNDLKKRIEDLHKQIDISLKKKALSEYNEGYSFLEQMNHNPNNETLLDDLQRPPCEEAVRIATED